MHVLPVISPQNNAAPTVFKQRIALPCTPLIQTFDIDATFQYELSGLTDFVFKIHAFHGIDQRVVSESLNLNPYVPYRLYTDRFFGNQVLRLQAQAGPLAVRYQARVERTTQPLDLLAQECSIADLPDDVLPHLNPTRYCESDKLSQTTQALFGQLPKGHARVQAIVEWIHQNISYQIGTSDATTTASDTLRQRTGVCRDFAHLGVTFCRALNIPARVVVGYAWFEDPPPDFHAVFEAYLANRWVMFDPTYMSPIDNLVRIAMGSDAKDVAFATLFGPAKMISMAPLVARA